MNDNNQNQSTEDQKRVNGTVKWFDGMNKGYGFIAPDKGNKDVFVHTKDTQDRLQEGDRVSFVIKQGPKGQNAADVKLINED